jgi:iron(III) transport system permease protein
MGLLLLLGLVLLLVLPVLTVLGAWFTLSESDWAQWQHLASTVLPGYAAESALLAAGVALGTLLVGGGAAALVSLFEFRGRRWLDFALLLPMAMPAYVAAYAYTDALQYSGVLQSGLREAFGWQGRLWGEVRSLPGAVILFVLCLYPYVYLLTRTALAERAAALLEAAQLLGASLTRRILGVALPLARPALAAGVLLVLMETLADYGVGSYFGLSTLTTGVYKAWLVNGDRQAAAQLASLLLIVVLVFMALERRAQSRLRFAGARNTGGSPAPRVPLRGAPAWIALALCSLPVVLGFVLPLLWLGWLAWQEWQISELAMGPRFWQWTGASLKLAGAASLLTVGLALALVAVQRFERHGPRHWVAQAATRLLGLGYAVPGAVIAVGLLLPMAWLQTVWPGATVAFTGTVLGLLVAYTVRFGGVALQSMEAGYARIPVTLDDSARLLGASRSRLLARLHLPLLRRAGLAAALLVFVDVMKELPATLLLRPFNHDTLAVMAYQLARDERLGEAALPAVAIAVVGLVPVALLWRAMRLR